MPKSPVNAIIRRVNMPAAKALPQALALVALGGKDNVRIMLQGVWQYHQSAQYVEGPKRAQIYYDGLYFEIDGKSVRPLETSRVNIEAKVPREVRFAK